MGKIREILKLIRVRQWYKGVIIFAGLFFGGEIFSIEYYPEMILGFFIVCFTSSMNYIINDLMDIEKDKHHPEKRNRPLASGAISKRFAVLLLILITVFVVGSSLFLMDLLVETSAITRNFSLTVLAIFITGFLYNMGLKKVSFLDIIILSLIYIWRTMAGCFIIQVEFSPWLYLVVFEIAMFLSIHKRKADKDICGENANRHKRIYDKYTEEMIKNIKMMITVVLLMTYSLYCVLGPIAGYSGPQLSNNRGLLIFSVPVAMYLVLRFLYISEVKPKIARNPELIITDIPIIIGAMVLAAFVFIANYWEIAWF